MSAEGATRCKESVGGFRIPDKPSIAGPPGSAIGGAPQMGQAPNSMRRARMVRLDRGAAVGPVFGPRIALGVAMKRRLLIVDDETSLLEALHDYFLTLHWEADAVLSIREAESRLAERQYDLVVTDLSLRGGDGDGLTLAGKIRRSHPRTPVVVLTARDIRLHQRAAAEQGV